jgi:hypothetical protein
MLHPTECSSCRRVVRCAAPTSLLRCRDHVRLSLLTSQGQTQQSVANVCHHRQQRSVDTASSLHTQHHLFTLPWPHRRHHWLSLPCPDRQPPPRHCSYASLGAEVKFENSSVPSLHAIPTMSTGTPCGTEGNYTEAAPHSLEACGYDGAREALSWIHPGLLPPAIAQDPTALVRFNQSEFGSPRAGLDLVRGGFVYVPKRCRQNLAGASSLPPCRVHVFVHGCGQQAAAGPVPYAMNDTYARRAGFNEIAESNGFVVL